MNITDFVCSCFPAEGGTGSRLIVQAVLANFCCRFRSQSWPLYLRYYAQRFDGTRPHEVALASPPRHNRGLAELYYDPSIEERIQLLCLLSLMCIFIDRPDSIVRDSIDYRLDTAKKATIPTSPQRHVEINESLNHISLHMKGTVLATRGLIRGKECGSILTCLRTKRGIFAQYCSVGIDIP
jgi:hypothetical protein